MDDCKILVLEFMEFRYNSKVQKWQLDISMIVLCLLLRGCSRRAFNMQWGNFIAILTVLIVVEMNQMHGNIF